MAKMKLSDIKIKKEFLETTPNERKIRECRNNWNSYRKPDRQIVVDSDGFLTDGYVQYLILMENNEEYAKVKVLRESKRYRNHPTTYVYGTHPNSECKKQYMWRVPESESWSCFAQNLCIGDMIICTTKFGCAPVIVEKVERLDECPVEYDVKRVCRKKIWRNGMVVNY